MPGMSRRAWLALGVMLALGIVLAAPLAADSPAPHTQQATGAVCPLSDDQNTKATQAIEKLAHTFTTEPRCVNCHGGVNPFGEDADESHGGGKLDPIYKTEKIVAPAGQTRPGVAADKAMDNEQCQSCHSAAPDWQLAPDMDVFKGQSVLQICKNQKLVFGKLKPGPPGPGGLASHLSYDPLIGTGFEGTRGLYALGEAGKNDPSPAPPKGVTRAELIDLAKHWGDALGSEFKGGEDCGCVTHHYALFLEDSLDVSQPLLEIHSAGAVLAPITFKDDGTFTGSGIEQRTVTTNIEAAPGLSCVGRSQTPRPWSLSGSVEGSDINSPGTMHIRVSVHEAASKGSATCQTPAGSLTVPTNVPGIDLAETGMPDVKALVGETSAYSILLPGGKSGIKLTIRQID